MNPKRKQRLFIVLFLLAGASATIGLIMYALSANINLFFTPKQIAAGEAPLNTRIRVGGLVVPGSLERGGEGQTLLFKFDLTDNADAITVHYSGILPDLFKEGQGIIAHGQLVEAGHVVADEVLAKHDENYMPPEIMEAIEEAGHPAKPAG